MRLRVRWTAALASSLGLAVILAVACGKSEVVTPPGDQNDGGGDDGQGGQGGFIPPPDSGSDSDANQAEAFTIQPANQVLNITGAGTTVQYSAISTQSGQPIPIASWYMDSSVAGTINAQGLFTASGQAGGVYTVSAESTHGFRASTTLTVQLTVTENPGTVTPDLQARLRAGQAGAGAGNVPDTNFRWLYPYNQTVFPRGLLAPTLQWDGQPIDALYLKVQSKDYSYEGFFGPASPPRLALAEALWRQVTNSAQAQDPVSVSVTKLSGTNITGPITETWNVAQGSLKGLVYYNTYDDPTATQGGSLDPTRRGAVMRIRPGQTRPDVLLGGNGQCTVCHSVSANGAVMSLSSGHFCNRTYTLSPSGGAASERYNDGCDDSRHDDTFSFAGLVPDGSLLLTSGSMPRQTPTFDFFPNIASVDDGDRDSKLYDTTSGQVVAAPGLDGVVHKALTPMFSPDGKWVAFMHYEAGQGHTLSVMQFDQPSHAFSNLAVVYNTSAYDGSLFAAWPAFTPDAKHIVFQVGDRRDYSSWRGGFGELFITNVNNQQATRLDLLNGLASGSSYLGTDDQARMSYEPTILPVAVGGYYWVVFTSRRAYGNTISNYGEGPLNPTDQDPSPKKLWVAAIDINYDASQHQDPSHPAFYLEGQDLVSGNMRAFWALEPCKQNGSSCESGSECCDGFCRPAADQDGGTGLVCIPPPSQTCAQEYEKCTTAADCCGVNQGFECINGFCARPGPR